MNNSVRTTDSDSEDYIPFLPAAMRTLELTTVPTELNVSINELLTTNHTLSNLISRNIVEDTCNTHDVITNIKHNSIMNINDGSNVHFNTYKEYKRKLTEDDDDLYPMRENQKNYSFASGEMQRKIFVMTSSIGFIMVSIMISTLGYVMNKM